MSQLLRPLDQADLSSDQKQSLHLVYIPLLNFIFIAINGIVLLVSRFLKDMSIGVSILLIILNSTIFLIPMLNFIFFVRFVAKLE